MVAFSKIAATTVSMASIVAAGSLADIEHVVSVYAGAFDHYFGTMAGVRGFADPNVAANGDKTVFQQNVNDTNYLNPWHLNYLGGTWDNATQCMVAGSNAWGPNQLALNHGQNNHWATSNTPYSWSHFKRDDIPVQFAIAEGWTVGDMYQEGVIASTNPNRVTWISGSINVPGSPQTKDDGGYPYIDNNETPGCDNDGINCYPLKWKTAGEFYQDAGVTWSVFQDSDNFDDNPYAWFKQFQSASKTSALYASGMKGQTLNTFYERAANGTLPKVSYIVGPTQLSEHPPYAPRDGAWLQKKVVEAVMNSPAYKSTVLIVSYDETGGLGDHVVPYRAPNGTVGEYLEDPWNGQGDVASGPGFRVPFYIVSPWTRGGRVLTEHADHNSQILFVEKWLEAKGYSGVQTDQMPAWRRAHMSNLVSAFDFDNPDYSLPSLPYAIPPHTNSAGKYDGASHCQSTYKTQRPPVPYSGEGASSAALADSAIASLPEQGFKQIRGNLTEGRYLVFEADKLALAVPTNGTSSSNSTSTHLITSDATSAHSDKAQRWVVYANEIGGVDFTISSAQDGSYLTSNAVLTSDKTKAGTFTVAFDASKGYSFANKCGSFITLAPNGQGILGKAATYFTAYSVSYHN